jgi:hypothetical protein
MVHQEGTHGPDDNDCEAEGNGTPCTLAKSMTEVFDTFLACQHREMESRCDDHKNECNCLESQRGQQDTPGSTAKPDTQLLE